MKFFPQKISDVILIKPTLHADDRGFFAETYRQDLLEDAIGYRVNFVQYNESKSLKGVLRGLHYQIQPYAQAKLVRVIDGSILDVAVDIRKDSPTFGKHVSIELTGDNMFQLFIPHGFAHGFVVLSDSATFAYKVDSYYTPEHDYGIAFNDEQLNVDWKLPMEQIQLSEKDKNHPMLSNVKELF